MTFSFTRANMWKTPAALRLLFSVFLFVLVFWYPCEYEKTDTDYVLFPDSPTYIAFSGWLDPWRSHRSIGYPAFIWPFLSSDRHKFLNALNDAHRTGINVWAASKKPLYTIAEETGVAKKFQNIVLAQRVILALAISIFYISLSQWFSPVFSFVALVIAVYLAPLPNPKFILTEPLSCALTWFCGAFLLSARKSPRPFACFALACLCAALAYLVRPQTLFLTGLCSVIFLYVALRTARRSLAAFLKLAIAFSPLLLAYGYIGWLSATGGQVFLHTHPNMYYSKFCFFAETEDSQYMPTERAKKITAWFGKHKAELIEKMKNGEDGYAQINITEGDSPPRKRARLGDGLSYGPLRAVWMHFKDDREIANLSLRGRVILGKELNVGLMYRHCCEILVSNWHNFIGGLGYYRDVWHLADFPASSFAINILALMLGVAAITLCPKVRWPIILMLCFHMGALLTAALGHFMLARYVDPTETFWLLAGMCSLWALRPRSTAHMKTLHNE